MEPKKVSDSQVEIAQVMMPSNANPKGNVQGGTIMKIVDDAALIVAERHSHSNCVTASIDRLDFISPVYVGNAVFAKASINYVSKTSMEIGVLVEAECLKTGVREHVASAYLTFVALNENDKPTEIPQIIPETEEEKRRYVEAQERRKNRLKYVKKKERNPDCISRI